MKIKILPVILFSWLFFQNLAGQSHSSQNKINEEKGHKIVFNIKDANEPVVYLSIRYQDKLLLRDSAYLNPAGQYIFRGDYRYESGLYSLVSAHKTPYVDFIIDKYQYAEFDIDQSRNPENFSVKNSPENEELFAYQRTVLKTRKQVQEIQRKRQQFARAKMRDSLNVYNRQLNSLQTEINRFTLDMIDRNPDFLFSKVQKSSLPVNIPESVLKSDTLTRNIYYRDHYWDNVDLGDSRLIPFQILENKYQDYFFQVLRYAGTDTLIKYVDRFLQKTENDSNMYRHFLDKLTYDFQVSKVLGHDAVFVHIAKNNHLKDKAYWLDEFMIAKYEKRVKNLEPVLIGSQAAELIIPDTSGQRWISSHTLPEKYILLWFYDPTCVTCKAESENLRTLYDSLTRAGTRNFEVYAVGNDIDIERWKRYVKENNYPWIQVGGPVANIDYMAAYNIYESGTPSLFILNGNREIILNRRIEIKQIPGFLHRYEKSGN